MGETACGRVGVRDGPNRRLGVSAIWGQPRMGLIRLMGGYFLGDGLGEAATGCLGWKISFLAAAHFCC